RTRATLRHSTRGVSGPPLQFPVVAPLIGGLPAAQYPATFRSDADRDDLEPVTVEVRQHTTRREARDGVFTTAPAEHHRDPRLACVHGISAYRLTATRECTVSRQPATRRPTRSGPATARAAPRASRAVPPALPRRTPRPSRCESVHPQNAARGRQDAVPGNDHRQRSPLRRPRTRPGSRGGRPRRHPRPGFHACAGNQPTRSSARRAPGAVYAGVYRGHRVVRTRPTPAGPQATAEFRCAPDTPARPM